MRLIDADAFDKCLEGAEIEATKNQKYVFSSAINTIRGNLANFPTANQWISVSERLPEDLEEVIVTWVNHDPESYYAFTKNLPFTGVAVYHRGKWYWYSSICTDVLGEYGRNDNDKMDDAIEVIAWMPLPEPYKEEQHD